MSQNQSTPELQIALNYRFPEALSSGDIAMYNEKIAERMQQVVSAELERLAVPFEWDSTCFFHLGTEIIPDSNRCSECGTWTIPEEVFHPTCAVSAGWRVADGRVLCEQCWSLFDGEKIPTSERNGDQARPNKSE